MSDVLCNILNSGLYSDLTLACHGEEFKVHKAIVCAQSPVLAAAVGGAFKEATTNVIQIDGFDAATVKRMVDFLYLGEYDKSKKPPSVWGQLKKKDPEKAEEDKESKETLSAHVHVNAIADYYNIEGLCALSKATIEQHFERSWSARHFVDVFKKDLPSTGDKEMQDIFASAAAKHIEELTETSGFIELDTFNRFTSKLIQDCSQKIAFLTPLQQVITKLETELNSERAALKIEKTKADNASKSIDMFMKVLQNLRCSSPGCGLGISNGNFPKIEKGDSLICVVRCGKCDEIWKDTKVPTVAPMFGAPQAQVWGAGSNRRGRPF